MNIYIYMYTRKINNVTTVALIKLFQVMSSKSIDDAFIDDLRTRKTQK